MTCSTPIFLSEWRQLWWGLIWIRLQVFICVLFVFGCDIVLNPKYHWLRKQKQPIQSVQQLVTIRIWFPNLRITMWYFLSIAAFDLINLLVLYFSAIFPSFKKKKFAVWLFTRKTLGVYKYLEEFKVTLYCMISYILLARTSFTVPQ